MTANANTMPKPRRRRLREYRQGEPLPCPEKTPRSMQDERALEVIASSAGVLIGAVSELLEQIAGRHAPTAEDRGHLRDTWRWVLEIAAELMDDELGNDDAEWRKWLDGTLPRKLDPEAWRSSTYRDWEGPYTENSGALLLADEAESASITEVAL